MNADEVEFWQEYSDLTGEICGSSYQFFDLNLRRWFDLLATDDHVVAIVAKLEALTDFHPWYRS
ncbi:hypothetical protein, partial [Hypericibacter sp.]|uniref:hypothetical protein n=1 Tax=Hypericibacter sp. TaxID=2705401 RepID=UPI003D6D5307